MGPTKSLPFYPVLRSERQIVVLILEGTWELLEVVSHPCSGSRGGLGLWRRSGSPRSAICSAITAARRTEHDQLADVDFGRVLRLAILVLPLAILDPSLDVQLVALLYIPLHDIRERRGFAVPNHAAMPFRLFLLRAARVVPRATGGEGERCDAIAARDRSDFRIAAEVSDQR